MTTLMDTCPSCHPRSMLVCQNLFCIAASAVCVVYAFKDPVHSSGRPKAEIAIIAGSGLTDRSTFSVINPIYLFGIAQSVALVYSCFDLFANGWIFFKRTHEEVFKLSMARSALSGVALDMGLLLLVSNEATFIPFLVSIAAPLVLTTTYAAAMRTKVLSTNWLLLHACLLVAGIFLTAFYLNTFFELIAGLSKIRKYARAYVAIGVACRFLLVWLNVMVRAVWEQGTRLTTTTYIHSTIDEATRFFIVFNGLAYVDDHKDYLIVGSAVALGFVWFPLALLFKRSDA